MPYADYEPLLAVAHNLDKSKPVPEAELADGELRLVADCSFYATKDRDVITIELSGDTVGLKEYPPFSQN